MCFALCEDWTVGGHSSALWESHCRGLGPCGSELSGVHTAVVAVSPREAVEDTQLAPGLFALGLAKSVLAFAHLSPR